MANERLSRLMQESLDRELSPQETEEMWSILGQDEQAAEEYDRLKMIDRILAAAPHERAPQRLAVTIMARLAQTLEAQARAKELPEATQQALLLSLALVMVVSMPMMVAASWLVISGMRDPEIINQVLYRMIALLSMVLEALETLMEEAEKLVHDNPEAAALAMALIPVVLIGILDTIEESSTGDG